VYGPTNHAEKGEFLQEIRDARSVSDFNMVYQVCDKNNGRLHPGLMRRFRGLLDDLQLDELHLSGQWFT
jgi:hypothetical protein